MCVVYFPKDCNVQRSVSGTRVPMLSIIIYAEHRNLCEFSFQLFGMCQHFVAKKGRRLAKFPSPQRIPGINHIFLEIGTQVKQTRR